MARSGWTYRQIVGMNLVLSTAMTLAAMGADLPLPGTGEMATEFGRFGVVAIMGVIVLVGLYMQYKQSEKYREASVDVAKSIAAESTATARIITERMAAMDKLFTDTLMVFSQETRSLCAELRERPCIRDPKND